MSTKVKFAADRGLRINGTSLIGIVILLCNYSLGDYDCLCNYKVETKVFPNPNESNTPIGYLYEFDCKAIYGPLQNGYSEIEFEHQIGYVKIEDQVETQTCQGDIPDSDKVTTSAPKITTLPTTTQKPTIPTTISAKAITATTTTSKPTTTTIHKPITTITTTQRPTTTTTTTPAPTTPTMTTEILTTITSTTQDTTITPVTTISSQLSTSVRIPEGHIELCPNTTKVDVNRNHGFLGQYGEHCYEYVPYHTQWKNAERHCHLVSGGHLATILHQREQEFILRFLQSHNHHDDVWIGLTDSESEGTWRWISGHVMQFKNFQHLYQSHTDKDHKLNDCVVLRSNGEWVDLPCGVQLVLGGGFGENHAYVCQYNLTATPPELFNGYLAHFIVG